MKKLLLLMAVLLTMAGCAQTSEDLYDVAEEVVEVAEETAEEVVEEVEEVVEEVAVEVEPMQLKVIAPYGTPVLTMAKMFVEKPEIAEHVTVDYEALQATDVLTSELINGNADFAIVPTNLAAVLASKDVGYKIAGSSVWGVFYIVTPDAITSFEALKGQRIGMIGQGLTPDAMFRYLLTENGLDPDVDVTLEYFAGSSELAANFISGQIDYAMMPQPVLTNVLMKREDANVAIDLQASWAEATGMDSYPLSSIIVKETLVEEAPELVEAFLAEYATSVAWLNENPAEAGAYYESLELGLPAAIIEKAIPACNLRFVPVEEAKDDLTAFLDVLFTFNPKIVGGQPADEGLYLEK